MYLFIHSSIYVFSHINTFPGSWSGAIACSSMRGKEGQTCVLLDSGEKTPWGNSPAHLKNMQTWLNGPCKWNTKPLIQLLKAGETLQHFIKKKTKKLLVISNLYQTCSSFLTSESHYSTNQCTASVKGNHKIANTFVCPWLSTYSTLFKLLLRTSSFRIRHYTTEGPVRPHRCFHLFCVITMGQRGGWSWTPPCRELRVVTEVLALIKAVMTWVVRGITGEGILNKVCRKHTVQRMVLIREMWKHLSRCTEAMWGL